MNAKQRTVKKKTKEIDTTGQRVPIMKPTDTACRTKSPRPNGRPPKYATVELLQARIDDYFAFCDARIREVFTETGAAIAVADPETYTKERLYSHLGICKDTASSWLHGDMGQGFSVAIKNAYTKIESDLILKLVERKTFTPGLIFYLKNAFGMKDKQDVEIANSETWAKVLEKVEAAEREVAEKGGE